MLRMENDQGSYARTATGKRASFAKNFFNLLNRLMNPVVKVLLKCVICFSISFRWYTFPSFHMQISHPLAYSVCISSKASATAAS